MELSTWEDEEAPKQQFPHAPAWGQAGSQGRGDVTVRKRRLLLQNRLRVKEGGKEEFA